jgi:hypothetical protein
MSDSQQPSFFGGLPPRSVETVTPPAAATSKMKAERAPREPLNRLAIIALVVSFFVSIAGIVLAVLALRQLRAREERGRGLALGALLVSGIGTAVFVALYAVFMFGGTSLVGNITGLAPTSAATSSPFEQQTFTKAEKIEAKTAVASGGGAVPGHIVSGDLCKAVSTFETVSKGKSTVSNVEPQVLASMQALAAVESPNQKAYAKMAGLAKDPASVTSIVTAQGITADFAKAIQVDVTTCP